MKNLKHILSSLVSDESGQDLIEYALVAALIALGATAAMTSLAVSISTAFSTVGSQVKQRCLAGHAASLMQTAGSSQPGQMVIDGRDE